MPTYNAQAALPGGEPGPWGDPVTINYEKRDVLLYAVGIGIQDLRFVFERWPEHAAHSLPTRRFGSAS